MKLLISLNLTIVLLITFFSTNKKLNILENLFLFMTLELIFNSYVAVLYLNFNFWEIDKTTETMIVFRLWEILIIPLLLVWYFNLLDSYKSKVNKLIITIFLIGAILGIETLLVHWEVIIYKKWHYSQSILSLLSILVIGYLSKKLFHHLLRNEGILS